MSLRVGTARADITPAPGVSLFGHGPEGRVADGYWSRLYCRVFVFEPDRATPLALVVCDLGAIGTLLQRTVAAKLERAAQLEAGVKIPASRVMMTATHTHAAPAHYFEGDFYGGFMSSRMPGFDPNMVEMLADEIADAIERAHEEAKPAALSRAQAAVWGLTRNRSLVPFQQNVPAHVPGSDCGAAPASAALLPEQRAVDPCLDVIRIDELDGSGAVKGPLGSISFFAMHPTVMPNTTRLINADVFGVTSRFVEKAMRKEWLERHPAEGLEHDPVHAVINSNEGDISPAWVSGSSDEAVAIGEELGRNIEAAIRLARPVPAVVNARYVEVHLPSAPLYGSTRRLCKTPTLGVAMPKGAADHPTALTLVGDFVDENVDIGSERECEAPRKPFLDIIQRRAAGTGAFPTDVPLAIAQLGDLIASFVPAELTVTAGHRLNRAVLQGAASSGLHVARAVVAGLANGYIQYVTTKEEYDLQHYEGASDIYGVWTAQFLEGRYAMLARSLAGFDASSWFRRPIDAVQPLPYYHAVERDRLPVPTGRDLTQIAGRGARFLCRLPARASSYCFGWTDAAPGDVPPARDAYWLSVVDDATGSVVRDPDDPADHWDDRGLAFQTRVHTRNGAGYDWSTVVTLPESNVQALHALSIHAGTGRFAVASPPLNPGGGAPVCSTERVIYCGIGR